MHDDGLIYLCAAILKQAAKDYRKAAREGRHGKVIALERFFRSEWGQRLSRGNGELIIERLKEQTK